ncbi:MAG: hypothetical protein K5668_06515 [Lachnospiraceae bacterium]|nr:hypothetical protein [Lachnospiraceae bacterium]
MEEKRKLVKKAGMQISVYMGITMSFFLSLMENIISGHFTLVLFLATFGASTALSLLIGFFVPMGPITAAVTGKMKPGSIGGKILSALISDLIYTPALTLAMIALVRLMVPSHALYILPPFPVMFIGSLIPAMIVGFVLIMIFMPVFQKMVFKKLGLNYPPGRQAPEE